MRALLLIAIFATAPALADGRASGNSYAEEMRPVTIHGYRLIDAEYLAFEGEDPVRYPEDVMWGFYAQDASAEARECAVQAYRQLRDFLVRNPRELDEAIELGATSGFFLWIDDYSFATPTRERRAARLWHWNHDDRDYREGYWKWEAVLTQSGMCILPDLRDARATLQFVADELRFTAK